MHPWLFRDSLEFAILQHKFKPWKLTKTINNSDLNHKFPLNWVFELGSKFQNRVFSNVFPHSFHIRHLEIWGCEWTEWKEWGKRLPHAVFLIEPHLFTDGREAGEVFETLRMLRWASIRDFKDLVCISEIRRWCALSRNNHPGKPLKTDAGQQEQGTTRFGTRDGFPWLADSRCWDSTKMTDSL